MQDEEELTLFEHDALVRILTIEAPDLLSHVPLLKVISREHTGAGQYTNLKYAREPELREPCRRLLGAGTFAEVDGCESSIGVLVNVLECKIGFLEIYVNGMFDLPKKIENYRFL